MAKKICKCCGNASPQDHGDFYACTLCTPQKPEERILLVESVKDDDGKVRKAKVREVTYRCTSPLCDYKKVLSRSNYVIEWIDKT